MKGRDFTEEDYSFGWMWGSALTSDAKLYSVADALYFLFCPKQASDKYLPDLGKERAWIHQKILREEMLNLFCPMFENKRSSQRSVCQTL